MLTVVLLPGDMVARAIEPAVKMPSLSVGHFAVSPCRRFLSFSPGLLSLQPFSFVSVQLPCANAPANPFLLTLFAPVNSRRDG
jgi:hypothetical protein